MLFPGRRGNDKTRLPVSHAILALRHDLDVFIVHQVPERDLAEKAVDLPAQFIPQLMGQAAIAALAVVRTTAARGIDHLVNGGNDFRNGNLLGWTFQ